MFDLEIIVVDDASSDDTPDILRGYPNIRYIRLDTNRGLAGARNEGLKASTGDYIAFNDDDDLWLPYKLSLLVPALEETSEYGVAYAQMIVKYDSGYDSGISLIPGPEAPSGHLFRTLLTKECFIGVLGILVRREVFDAIGTFDERMDTYEDIDWILRAAWHFRFTFVNAPVALYRLSFHGKYITDIIQGRTERALHTVVQNALDLVPQKTEDYAQLRQQAFGRLELKVAEEFEWLNEMERMQTHLLNAIRECPRIVDDPSARSIIEREVCLMVKASSSPIAAVRAFGVGVKATGKRNGFPTSWALRAFMSEVWILTAVTLAFGSDEWVAEARIAAGYAMINNPLKLGSANVVRAAIRTLLGSGHYTAMRTFILGLDRRLLTGRSRPFSNPSTSRRGSELGAKHE